MVGTRRTALLVFERYSDQCSSKKNDDETRHQPPKSPSLYESDDGDPPKHKVYLHAKWER